jgi:N-acyl-D-amino-acid deacylase
VHDLVVTNARIVDGTGAPGYDGAIAVDDDIITEVGAAVGAGRRTIDAQGRLVTPGWVDIHTHYDGQATWDPELAPSSWHGTTTVVTGSCGVGFAPVAPDRHEFLVELMEGVEDIPGTALHEGLTWGWETFAEYLDVLATMPRTVDVGALVPHTAVRAYVMGDRCHEDDTTPEDRGQMAMLVADAIGAGALGFSTSRTILHSSVHGFIPGTTAAPAELLDIAAAMAGRGRSVFQFVDDFFGTGGWVEGIAELGLTVSYSLSQANHDPEGYRRSLDRAALAADRGLVIAPQTGSRPVGMLWSLEGSFHPLLLRPTAMDLHRLPLDEQIRRLADPDVRAAAIDEEMIPSLVNPITQTFCSEFDRMYRLGTPPEYEPDPSQSAEAVARTTGRRPEEVVLDWLVESDGHGIIYRPLAGYSHDDLDAVEEMLRHPTTISGLSDGGAHCGMICDASMPTYLLTHWCRDRTRGAQLPIELAVHKQTGATASVFGLADRGTLEPGKLADLNVIDFDALAIEAPRMVHDLPAGGRRLVQGATGYDVTVKSGVVTAESGALTGERPGRLVRRT